MKDHEIMRRWLVLLAVFAVVSTAAPASGVGGFGDVEPGRFYTTAVQWMVDNDITTGTSRACFSPDDPVSRAQAAAFLWRMEGFPTGAPPHPFHDVVAPWQQAPVSWMADEGITTGTSATTFSPDDPVTRGQFAAFSYRWKGEPATTVDDASPLCLGRDEFNGSLAQGWDWFLAAEHPLANGVDDDPTKYGFTTMPGYLSITGGGTGDDFSPRQLLRDPVADDCVIETRVRIAPSANFQQAGLVVRPDTAVAPATGNAVTIVRAACDITSRCVGDGIYMDNSFDGSPPDSARVALPAGTGDVWLRLRHVGGTFTGSYSTDGTTWTDLASHDRDFGTPVYGILTGNSAAPVVADFDYFMETPA